MATHNLRADSLADLGGQDRAHNEWILAEMENKVRVMISGLMTPVVKMASDGAIEVGNLRSLVSDHTAQISEMCGFQNKITEVRAGIETIRGELSKVDRKVHESLLHSDEEKKGITMELDVIKRALEARDSNIHKLERSTNQAANDIVRVEKELRETNERLPEQIDACQLRAHKQKCELEAKIVRLELQHASLTDQLWGEETGLAKVAGEQRKTSVKLEEVISIVVGMQTQFVHPEELQSVRRELNHFLRSENAEIQTLKTNVGSAVNEVKEHLRTGLEAAASHFSESFQHLVGQCREEIGDSARLRDEVSGFTEDVKEKLIHFENLTEKSTQRNVDIVAELQNECVDVERRRKRDAVNKDVEISSIGKRMANLNETVTAVATRFERVNEVAGMTLEVMHICSALTAQDDVDRANTNLIGIREEASGESIPTSPSSPSAPKGVNASPRRVAGVKSRPILSMDKRCMSCCDQPTLVLQAFKMACLAYDPQPVKYHGQESSRRELVQKMETLIQSARQFYNGDQDMATGDLSSNVTTVSMALDFVRGNEKGKDKGKLPDLDATRKGSVSGGNSVVGDLDVTRKGSVSGVAPSPRKPSEIDGVFRALLA